MRRSELRVQVLASTSALDAAQTAADTARLLPEEAELAASRAEAAVDVALSLAGSKRPGKELSALRSAACMARHHAAQSALAAADDAAASIAASRLDTAEQAVDSATLTYREAVAASGPTSVAAQAAQEQLAVCQQQAGEACRAVAALPSTMLQDDRDSALACGCTIEMQRTSSAAKLPNAPAAPPKSSPSHQHVLQVGIAGLPFCTVSHSVTMSGRQVSVLSWIDLQGGGCPEFIMSHTLVQQLSLVCPCSPICCVWPAQQPMTLVLQTTRGTRRFSISKQCQRADLCRLALSSSVAIRKRSRLRKAVRQSSSSSSGSS